MKRRVHPPSSSARKALTLFEQWLREREVLILACIHNYLSELGHFIAWFETERKADVMDNAAFTLHLITNPTLMCYRCYLQMLQKQKTMFVNDSPISLNRYLGWIAQHYIIPYDSSIVVKLAMLEESAPRHLDNQEEQELVEPVTKTGKLRDCVLIVLVSFTIFRPREVGKLRCNQVHLVKLRGFIEIVRKRNKYREMSLTTVTSRVLEEYLATFPAVTDFILSSVKTKDALLGPALGYIVKKYAYVAKLPDVSTYVFCHRFGYQKAESVSLNRLIQIMGHDALDCAKLYTYRTKHNLQLAVETIA